MKSKEDIKKYLDGLKWDGAPRVDKLFKDYMGADMPEPYLSDVSRKFMQACIKRIYEPGCKWDYVVVLEGEPGCGKSMFGSILAQNEFFLDNWRSLNDRDTVLYLQDAWICEISNIEFFINKNNEEIKRFITRCTDHIADERRRDFPRGTVFFATSDKHKYLTDPNGNRCYWPMKIKKCNYEALEKDRDQLWAEALHHYQFAPEDLYLKDQSLEIAEKLCRERTISKNPKKGLLNGTKKDSDSDHLRL